MKELVLSENEISAIVERLGKTISQDLASEEKPPVFVCVMKGAMPFFSDLIKKIDLNIVCDYVQLSSYGGGLTSSGSVCLTKDLSEDITDRTVVIVEDIVDSGISMRFLTNHIKAHYQPKEVRICALFDKEVSRTVDLKVDYVGRRLEKAQFLVGYGLDYREMLRNVPYVYVPTKEEIEALDRLADD